MLFSRFKKNKPIFINDYSIFNCFPKDACYQLSSLNENDLANYFFLLNKYYLEYLTIINLDPNLTFGLEIEFEYVLAKLKTDLVNKEISEKVAIKGWEIKVERTLSIGNEVTSPPLIDSVQSWLDIKEVCNIINYHACATNKTASHIHYGKQILGEDPQHWQNFLKLWAAYEKVIFRFAYGEDLTARSNILKYAKPVANDILNMIGENRVFSSLDQLFYAFQAKHDKVKSTSIAFDHLIPIISRALLNTIEVRVPNGTIDPVIWQNNINFFGKLLKYALSENFNDQLINERIEKDNPKNFDLLSYDSLYLDSAIELCDLIFDNNLDKIYFLRQYTKGFEISKNGKNSKAPTFVKKG